MEEDNKQDFKIGSRVKTPDNKYGTVIRITHKMHLHVWMDHPQEMRRYDPDDLAHAPSSSFHHKS